MDSDDCRDIYCNMIILNENSMFWHKPKLKLLLSIKNIKSKSIAKKKAHFKFFKKFSLKYLLNIKFQGTAYEVIIVKVIKN